MATANTAVRTVWMDYTRGAAILLIILHHIGALLDQTSLGAAALMRPVDDFFTPFRMPILMFLSGMLLTKSLAKPVGQYVTGKLGGIAWPYLVWTVIILAVGGELTAGLLFEATYNSPTYLWYLWFLLAYYAGVWVIAKLRIPIGLVLVASFILAYVAPDSYRVSRFFYLFIFFVAGDLVARNWNTTLRAVRSNWGAAAAILIALFVAGLSVAGVAVRYEVIYIIGVLAAAWLIVRFMPRVKPRRSLGWLEFIGRHSIVFYVSHVVVIQIVIDGLAGLTDSHLITYAAAFVVTVAVGFTLAFAAEKSPVAMLAFKLPLRPARRKLEPASR